MNETNRTAIVLLAAAWIVLMIVVVFLTWAAPGDSIEALGDLVQEMDNNNDTAGRLVLTLGALALAIFGLLVIILELAPEDEERELKVKQAGSTTIVPAQALRQRVEEAIGGLPDVSTAKAKVWAQDNAIATNLDLGLVPRANIANVTQEASRVVVDIIQTELGLPVAGLPEVRISFGGEKPAPVPAPSASASPDSSSLFQRPAETPPSFQRPQSQPQIDPREMIGGIEDAPPAEPPVVDATEGTADSSPGPLVYETESAPQPSEVAPPLSARGEEPPPPPPPDDASPASAAPAAHSGESAEPREDKPADERQA